MKKYQIIYADPAWLYQCGKNHLAKKSMINGKTDIHYNAMPIKEMEQMKINEIADDDCLLFMWVTSPFLKIGIDLMNKWGFDFSTIGFVWYKEKIKVVAISFWLLLRYFQPRRHQVQPLRGRRV